MDSINDEPSMSVEDRISNLPDDIIHRVLSSLDMKYVVQTCVLSHRWKHIWTSTPYLNLNSSTFRDLFKFDYFVEHLLVRRNSLAEVSAVDLTYSGLSKPVVRSIVNYAYTRNARQLKVTSFDHIWYKFPQYLFTSHTLKYLAIIQNQYRDDSRSRVPNSAWFFPALETLHLENIRFGVDGDKNVNLFSKCLNLKDLTLHKCCMYGLESFSIYAPLLLNLIVTESSAFPKVLRVVAPQLKNLTASVNTRFGNQSSCFLRLSTECFGSIEKVNLSASNPTHNKQELASIIIDLFQVVRNVKLLIVDVDIIMCLSSSISQLVQEPTCPFDNLKCLKISNCFTQVRNYLLENSPNVTFIMDLLQVSHKRSRQDEPDDTMPIKVAKLEATLQIRDQLIANQKTELQMKDQVIANQNADIHMKNQVIADQNANIQLKDQVTANQNTNIQMKDHVIANLNTDLQMKDQVIGNLNADIQMKDEVIADQNADIQMNDQLIANQNENIQLKDKVITKLKEMIRRLKSNNIPTHCTSGDAMTRHH